ncbi:MAG: hypothetical protein V9G12_09155 [Microthrixaceae bacterium]
MADDATTGLAVAAHQVREHLAADPGEQGQAVTIPQGEGGDPHGEHPVGPRRAVDLWLYVHGARAERDARDPEHRVR